VSVVFAGTYRHQGAFNADGSLVAAAGTVAVTPTGRSTVTATLDGNGSYQTTLAAFAGRVTVVETLTGAATRTSTVDVVDGQSVDTSRDFFVAATVSVVDGGTP